MREIIDFDKDWLFHKGDIENEFVSYKGLAYIGAKTERYHKGPACKDYFASCDSYEMNKEHKTEKWERVELPHDYVVESVPKKEYNCALGWFPYENSWYRKTFRLTSEDKNKRITLLFEAVATNATVYLNGCLMKHNFCGYTTFEVDITDVVKYDHDNVLAVYVNTQNHEGWWYEGGGIYRHVHLIKTDLTSVDLWGIYAKPEKLEGDNWRVVTKTTVRNDHVSSKKVKILGEIVDENGQVVATSSASGTIRDKDKREFTYCFDVKNPELYYPDSPTRYTMRATVYNGSKKVDSDEVKFGFRTFKIDPDNGLFINGKHYKIKGVCGHADCGLLGKAVPDNVHAYKVQLMKEMGANGYRTSHYPQAEALMEELDKNGFIVMDETRWFESTDEGKAQLEMLMKRDRNRACVFFWSVGNEEPHHVTEEGRRICQSLTSYAHKLDDSRVIMTAVCHNPDKATVYDELEAIGVNYNWNMYEYVHKKFPTKGVFSSECCASGTTRGWYYDSDPVNGFMTAYDHDSSDAFRGREFTWKYLDSNPWLLGGYQWIAFEHRGEAIWPRLCSQSGAIDLYLQKKDAFYQNKSHWTTQPMVHLLPHWNFAGHEGRIINVWAYTNAPFVELFLNGASLGKLAIEKHGHGEWQVAYTPGVIEAVAYDENGKEIARDKKVTSGKPYALKLSMDTPNAKPNGKDVAIMTCYVVDKDGNEVYDACPTVRFSANGSGKILSTGSDVTDHEPLFLPYRRMRAGRIGVAVKMLNSDKPLTVIAEADGINTAVYYDSFGKTSDFSLKFEQELAPVQEDAKSTGKPV